MSLTYVNFQLKDNNKDLCYRIHGNWQRHVWWTQSDNTLPLTSAGRPLCSYRCHPNTQWLFLRDCSISHTGLIYHIEKQTRVRRASRVSFLKQLKRINGSPFFVLYKDLVQVTGVMHKHWILNLPQKTCVHFHKILLEWRTWKYSVGRWHTDSSSNLFSIREGFVTHWYIDEHFFNIHTRQRLSQRLHKELKIIMKYKDQEADVGKANTQ